MRVHKIKSTVDQPNFQAHTLYSRKEILQQTTCESVAMLDFKKHFEWVLKVHFFETCRNRTIVKATRTAGTGKQHHLPSPQHFLVTDVILK